MRNYRPVRGRRVVNKKRIVIFGAAVAAAVFAVIFCVSMFSDVTLTPEQQQELLETGTFMEGVSVEGVDVGGLTYAQGEEKLRPVVEEMQGQQVQFTIQGQQYTYALTDLGASVDYEGQLTAAMLYGREGKRWDLVFGTPEPKDFPLTYAPVSYTHLAATAVSAAAVSAAIPAAGGGAGHVCRLYGVRYRGTGSLLGTVFRSCGQCTGDHFLYSFEKRNAERDGNGRPCMRDHWYHSRFDRDDTDRNGMERRNKPMVVVIRAGAI